ncbi:MAG: hypothetical protein FRX49_10758 [Trebouxia sp. A1-2]|nr:MAG: hypothetical protein FRX49_10758 [Trebouxia sp. A1-2]
MHKDYQSSEPKLQDQKQYTKLILSMQNIQAQDKSEEERAMVLESIKERAITHSGQNCGFEVILHTDLSIVRSNLRLEFPRKLDATHPLRDAGHLLSEHLCVLDLLARPLHHHHQAPTTQSNRQQANNRQQTNKTDLRTEVATVQNPKEISRKLGNPEDYFVAKTRQAGQGRAGQGRAGQRRIRCAARSTAQHSTAQHSTAQHSTAQRNAAQRSAGLQNLTSQMKKEEVNLQQAGD